jgi:hypothetical protein
MKTDEATSDRGISSRQPNYRQIKNNRININLNKQLLIIEYNNTDKHKDVSGKHCKSSYVLSYYGNR